MKIKFWGVRGSIPTPPTPMQSEERITKVLKKFIESGKTSASDIDPFLKSLPRHDFGGFGGNTSCLEINTPSTQMIIDCGSGMRPLGYQMMDAAHPSHCGKGQGKVHIFMTHFHWDHLTGLPFFTPVFIPGNEIHFYAVQPELEKMIRSIFTKPNFPVPYEGLASKIFYHALKPREPYQHGDLTVTPYELDHPDPCWGFRIEETVGGEKNTEKKSVAYCVDTECTRVSAAELKDDIKLYENLDLMIFDAQYTLMEAIEKVHWGHAAATIGLDLAIMERIPNVIFMHHDPAASDEKIQAAVNQAAKYLERQKISTLRSNAPFFNVDWKYAFEGMEVEV